MMNQQPDKIFRDKLNNLQRPAPAAAWDRIETNLKKNNTKTGWWWKVAASLLLLAIATYILWPAKSIDQPLATTAKQDQIAASESNEDTNASTAPLVNKTDSVSVEHQPGKKLLATKASVKRKSVRESVPAKETTAQALDTTIAVAQNDESLTGVEPTDEQTTTPPVASAKPKGLKLQFSAAETNKYLDENALAQATSEGKKPSTFKKLLKKANELKSNQDPFGDLREKKNEILALNFKNEKRGQNK
jgi:hypothetical protein